jgi:hypothetical protein
MYQRDAASAQRVDELVQRELVHTPDLQRDYNYVGQSRSYLFAYPR